MALENSSISNGNISRRFFQGRKTFFNYSADLYIIWKEWAKILGCWVGFIRDLSIGVKIIWCGVGGCRKKVRGRIKPLAENEHGNMTGRCEFFRCFGV